MKSSIVHRECGRIFRTATSADGRALPAALSFGAAALDDHAVDPRGWIVPDSKSVPFVDSHRDREGIRTVLGRVTNIRVGTAEMVSGQSATALLGTLNFAEPAVNPDAEVAYQLYKAAYVDSVSVSFIPVEWVFARDRGPGAMNVSSARLLEVSAVAVPSDENARVLARAVRARLTGRETSADRLARARALLHAYPAQPAESAADRYQRALAIRATLETEEALELDRLWDAWSGRRGCYGQ
jgi:HK97 family phage prohead protease